jgi:hypothetical protein
LDAEYDVIECIIPVMNETQIHATNIRAVQQLYFAAMFEELQAFNVMDRLVELFQSRLLPIGSSASGEKLYEYWKQQNQRLSTSERKSLYQRVLGLGGGDAGGEPNREFEGLWLRFISAVSSAADRRANADPADRRIRQQAVRKSGRELAANLSLHGHGFAYFAARDLNAQIKTITNVLSDPEIRSAYAAKDMWQVIDKVAALELGGAPNIVRYRTLAETGSAIMSWLATIARELTKGSSRPILRNQRDRPLIAACERWLLAQAQSGGT